MCLNFARRSCVQNASPHKVTQRMLSQYSSIQFCPSSSLLVFSWCCFNPYLLTGRACRLPHQLTYCNIVARFQVSGVVRILNDERHAYTLLSFCPWSWLSPSLKKILMHALLFFHPRWSSSPSGEANRSEWEQIEGSIFTGKGINACTCTCFHPWSSLSPSSWHCFYLVFNALRYVDMGTAKLFVF